MEPHQTIALIFALTTAGCGDFFGDKDAHDPGTSLGRFHVEAAEGANSCGAGALGGSGDWEFDVGIARDEGEFFWDNGAQKIAGTLASDDVTFALEATFETDMRDGHVGLPPCSVVRSDRASGVLEGEPEVVGFAGTLAFGFSSEGDCSDLVSGDEPIFAALPCVMSYAMVAERTEAPRAE